VWSLPLDSSDIKVGNTEDYQITLTLKQAIPVSGTIVVELPSQIIFKAASTCAATGAVCTINTTAKKATFVFAAGRAAGVSFILTFTSLRNP